MLDNMPGICAFFDTAYKTAFLLIAAAMRNERRHHIHHTLVKRVYLGGRLLLIVAYIKTHYDELFPIAAPIIRTAKCAYFQDLHKFVSPRRCSGAKNS